MWTFPVRHYASFFRPTRGAPSANRNTEEAVINAEIARKIYELRTKAGLTQQQLAVRVGTSKSAICRLEDADHEGHSLSILKRVAEALDKRVQIRFVPAKRLKTTLDILGSFGPCTQRTEGI